MAWRFTLIAPGQVQGQKVSKLRRAEHSWVGPALNLNPHLHMLFLDGAYRFGGTNARFHRARRARPD